jgi:hemolysin activation/secretion protein
VAQDSAYARTSLGFEGRTPVTGSLEVMAGLGYDWSVDSALAAAVGEGWVGTGLVIDTRDFAPAPTRGLRIRGATRAGSRSSSSTQVVSRAELDAVVHLPLNDALGATVRLGGRTVHASVQLSAAELYELGGAGSVRGFREGQFLGRQAVWVTAEPGWRAGTFEVYPFVDAGAYAGSQSRGIVAGYGFGLSASSRAGSAAADFGIAWGESPLRGKIHMGLTAAF